MFEAPDKQTTHNEMGYIPSPISKESSPWFNNTTGLMPRTSDDRNPGSQTITPLKKLSNSNTNLDYLSTTSQGYFDEFFQDSYQDRRQSSPIVGTDLFNQVHFTGEEPHPTIEEKIIDYLWELENSSYPDCIPDILPCNQGNITNYCPQNSDLYAEDSNGNLTQSSTHFSSQFLETNLATLRHNRVNSPTDSGFTDRLSTTSFSSTWSCEETSQNIGDFYSWALDSFPDSVF